MSLYLHTRTKTYNLAEETLVMGILNVTPDSFSDGGLYTDVDRAVHQAERMVEEGARIIDIGGESTRPGHEPVTEREELQRVIPVIEAVSRTVDVPISIDTYKSEVAKQAVEHGASIINDVWGALKDPAIADVAARYDVPIILTHNREDRNYTHLITDMKQDLRNMVDSVKARGVKDAQIILDPGIGFAKSQQQNLVVMRHLKDLRDLGYPLLLGTSRKSFIGTVLDLPKEERMEGTGATVCYGISQGVEIVRVHDVQPVSRMVKMMDAMIGKGGGIG
ncbi:MULTISPECIES: dihydropteroate synthase [Halobacillus]|uniref:dihydropteroate synthase n=1 Tax=Halobacillus TaxID=45667 RepID=UPI001369EF94|nr:MULTISPECIES: dihydropteroate synthase [Halobacillus]MYL31958.1 dihydropteroate synthase [Halobacillus halophilus]MYL39792.1 dihydropteroate synthase [Halobacillus litoralis]